jgi:hypothetical protein
VILNDGGGREAAFNFVGGHDENLASNFSSSICPIEEKGKQFLAENDPMRLGNEFYAPGWIWVGQ